MPSYSRLRLFSLSLLCTTLLSLTFGCTDDTALQQATRENSRLKSSISTLNNTNDELNRKQNRQNSEIRKLKSENKKLQKEVKNFQGGLDELANEKENLLAEINNQRNTISRLKREISNSQGQVSQVKAQLAEKITTLEQKLSSKEMDISELEGKLSMTILNSLIFSQGSAELTSDGRQLLEKVGNVLKEEKDQIIRVEGHTDNTPIRANTTNPNYSNWELSATRAINVIHFLEDTVGIAGERLVAVGYGSNRPKASNDSSDERAKNRRIEIVLSAAQ